MRRWLIALALLFGSASQADVTDNLITNPSFVGTTGWTTTGAVGGAQWHPASPANGSYSFTYSQGTIAQTYAINQALANAGAGVQVSGFDYGFKYQRYCANNIGGYCENPSGTADTLLFNATITNSAGATIYTDNRDLSGGYMPAFANIDVQQRFANPYELANLGTFRMSFTGQDNGYWGGNYGPTIKDVYSRAVYTAAPPPVVTTPTFSDDSYVAVPLQFGFPFYGRTFTNSWMHSNGVVSFLDPAVPIEGVGYNPGAGAYCCGDRPTTTRPEFSYMIAPLWTDLYPDGESTFRTEGTPQYQRYSWTNLGEISNGNNRSSFGLEIRPSGFIGASYTQINMNQTAWIGTVGNPAAGEINEIFYGSPGINYRGLTSWSSESTPVGDLCLVDPLSSPTCAGYAQAMCAANPLYATTCAGYAQAYYTQQCSANPLYDTGCPGYAEAYLTQQCSANALYSPSCPGYADAYLTQQCSNNPLFSVDCQGYAQASQQCQANPLSYSYCPGYQTASATCTSNPLSNTLCLGYTTATASCSANVLNASYCLGYQTALTNCSTDPLSNNMCPTYTESLTSCNQNPLSNNYCPGYQTAVTTCSNNVLNAAYCPGYETALNTCSTDPLSNTLCSGYQTASTTCSANQLTYSYCPGYKTALTTCSTDTQSNPLCPGYKTQVATEIIATSISTASAEVAATPTVESVAIADPTVAAAVAAPAATSATSTTSVTSVVAAPAPTAATSTTAKAIETVAAAPVVTAAKQEEQKTESKKADAAVASVEKKAAAAPATGANKSEAAKAAAIQRAKELTAEAGKAETLEAQTAVQGAVLGLMNYVPGFSAYQNTTVPDVLSMQVVRQYGKPPVDNARSQRLLGGANERLWRELVDSQYK